MAPSRRPSAARASTSATNPAAAAAVLPTNGRRIVRALEVIELTGGPFHAQLPAPRPHYPAVVIGLDREPADLDQRVATRVDRMWAAGFVDEVAALAAEGLRDGPTASRALGYAQVLAQLDGELSPEEARARTVSTTRRFVRRQRSWFRRDPAVRWFDAASTPPAPRSPDGRRMHSHNRVRTNSHRKGRSVHLPEDTWS